MKVKIQELFSEIDHDIEELYGLLLDEVESKLSISEKENLIQIKYEEIKFEEIKLEKIKQSISEKKNSIEEKFDVIKRLLDEISDEKCSDFKQFNTLYCDSRAAYYELIGNEVKCNELLKQCELNGKKDDKPVIAKYLNYFYIRIKYSNNECEKAKNYNRIANFYCKRGDHEERKTFMRSISNWLYAKDNYAKALECVKNDGVAVLGYAKCLFKLSKFNEGLNYLKSHNFEKNSDNQKFEYYLLMSQMERKIQNYSRVHINAALNLNPDEKERKLLEKEIKILNNCMPEKQKEKMEEYKALSFDYDMLRKDINVVLEKDPNNIRAKNEREILDIVMPEKQEKKSEDASLVISWDYFKTRQDKQKEKMDEYKATSLDYDEDYFKTHNSVLENNQTYNILSIDGGGIRGIIPAVWLCEIEKRAHRPISHLFNMVAGTSTGGIIAGGLAKPLVIENKKSTITPQYRAWDILDIYLKDGKKIFKNGSFLHRAVKKLTFGLIDGIYPKYTDEGREGVLTEYFGNSKLSDSLIDVVIPAANERNLNQTYLFNKHDAQHDPFLDDRFVDALMSTSAAPTFFPPYEIPGKGIFDDGAVHVNNPTSVAIGEASRYNRSAPAPKKLFVVSMGTGAEYPSTSRWPKLCRTNIFWAFNLKKVALPAQTGNTDKILYDTFGKDYLRWQVLFEDEIALDNCEKDKLDILTDKAHQFIEELDYSDDNSMNMLVERLLLNADKDNSDKTHVNPDKVNVELGA